MNKHHNLLAECYLDTLLVEALGFKKANHKFSFGALTNSLQKDFKGKLAVGIVDEDKRKPKYFREFSEEKAIPGARLMKHKQGKHYLIVISPAAEGFILNSAKSVEIKPPEKFRELESFKKLTKRTQIKNDIVLKDFLNTIKQKNAPAFTQITRWINEKLNL